MKIWNALARSLARSAPLWRQKLVTVVADYLAAGDTVAAERAGRFLGRRAYGEACQRAAQLQRKTNERAVARFVSRCFATLQGVAARIRTKRAGRR